MKSVHQVLHEMMSNFKREFYEVPLEIVFPKPLFERLAHDILPRLNYSYEVTKLSQISEISLQTLHGQLKIKRGEPEIDPWLKQFKLREEKE